MKLTTISSSRHKKYAHIRLPSASVDSSYLKAFSDALQEASDNKEVEAIVLAPADKRYPQSFSAATYFAESLCTVSRELTDLLRKLETLPKPAACLLPTGAHGIGLEIALSCHHRYAYHDTTYAFPEVKSGLIPAHGGIQRLMRLIGIEAAFHLLATGKRVYAEEMYKLGVIDTLLDADASEEKLLDTCLQSMHRTQQPWDGRDFVWPGKHPRSLEMSRLWMFAPVSVRKRTQGIYPAPEVIAKCMYEGMRLDFPTALKSDQKYWRNLWRNPSTANMVKVLHVDKVEVARSAAGLDTPPIKNLGVVGAGMMGAGIAIVAACAGKKVQVYDVSQANLDSMQQRLRKHLPASLKAEDIRIETISDYKEFSCCELVIEAVFEDRALKKQVLQNLDAVLPSSSIIASNTSTLPITSLANYTERIGKFIGLHFFSPVEKMPLVEVIQGKSTEKAVTDTCLSFVSQLTKIPIVVNDGRSFYTSRVFMTYILESMELLHEGYEPQIIEQAGLSSGMPVAPFALTDEISLELVGNIFAQTLEDGDKVSPVAQEVVEKMLAQDRRGRKNGRGFYEYDAHGGKKLWGELRVLFGKSNPPALSLEKMQQRLLLRQTVEALRCLREGIVLSERDANIGSVFGWGFPVVYGGVLGYVDTLGKQECQKLCDMFAEKYGTRFQLPGGSVKV